MWCQRRVYPELPKSLGDTSQTATFGPRAHPARPNLAHVRRGLTSIPLTSGVDRPGARSQQRGYSSSSAAATGARAGVRRRWRDRGAYLAMAGARRDRGHGRHSVLARGHAPSRRGRRRSDSTSRRGLGLRSARRSLTKPTKREGRKRSLRSRPFDPGNLERRQFETKIDSISVLTWSSVCFRAIAISLTISVRAVSSIRRSPKESCLSVFSR